MVRSAPPGLNGSITHICFLQSAYPLLSLSEGAPPSAGFDITGWYVITNRKMSNLTLYFSSLCTEPDSAVNFLSIALISSVSRFLSPSCVPRMSQPYCSVTCQHPYLLLTSDFPSLTQALEVTSQQNLNWMWWCVPVVLGTW